VRSDDIEIHVSVDDKYTGEYRVLLCHEGSCCCGDNCDCSVLLASAETKEEVYRSIGDLVNALQTAAGMVEALPDAEPIRFLIELRRAEEDAHTENRRRDELAAERNKFAAFYNVSVENLLPPGTKLRDVTRSRRVGHPQYVWNESTLRWETG